MRSIIKLSAITGLVVMAAGVIAPDASALPQFARKYKTACSTCHTQFPRPNYYGERFVLFGFQDPDSSTADGDTQGKTSINEDLNIDWIKNFLGVRFNFTPIRYRTDATVVDGKVEDQLDFGNANWFQLFAAGSVLKNVSLWAENEITSGEAGFEELVIGFHSIFDSTAVNFRVGKFGPTKWSSFSGSKRLIGPVKPDVFSVKPADGAGVDGLSIAGEENSLEYYGYVGNENPMAVWWAGVTDGGSANKEYNWWAGLKIYTPESLESFEGSSISAWYYDGTETNEDFAVTKAQDDYYRFQLAGNLRYGDLDVQGMWITANDDNWNLSNVAALEQDIDFSGWAVHAGYNLGRWYPTAGYDEVNSSDVKSLEKSFVTLGLGFQPRENLRIGAYARIDTENRGNTDAHDFFMNIRGAW